MDENRMLLSRRHFLGTSIGLGAIAVAGSSLYTPGVFAQQLSQTPAQMEGPFFPDKLPLDTDNDLLVINDSITPGVGAVTYLSGRILDRRGQPIRGAVVQIWQADNNGCYLHSGSDNKNKQDKNFQGFGRFMTGSNGEYYFRTIKPVPYPGRAPHIHFNVQPKGGDKFTTQLYIKGFAGNETDQLFKAVDVKARPLLVSDFTPIKESKIGELAARWDIVLGYTPAA